VGVSLSNRKTAKKKKPKCKDGREGPKKERLGRKKGAHSSRLRPGPVEEKRVTDGPIEIEENHRKKRGPALGSRAGGKRPRKGECLGFTKIMKNKPPSRGVRGNSWEKSLTVQRFQKRH